MRPKGPNLIHDFSKRVIKTPNFGHFPYISVLAAPHKSHPINYHLLHLSWDHSRAFVYYCEFLWFLHPSHLWTLKTLTILQILYLNSLLQRSTRNFGCFVACSTFLQFPFQRQSRSSSSRTLLLISLLISSPFLDQLPFSYQTDFRTTLNDLLQFRISVFPFSFRGPKDHPG